MQTMRWVSLILALFVGAQSVHAQDTPTPEDTETPTETATPEDTETPTETPTPEDTPTETATPEDTATPTVTQTPTVTATATNTATPTLIFRGGTGFEDTGAPEVTLNGSCGLSTTNCHTGDKCYRVQTDETVCNAAISGLASAEKRFTVVVKGATFENGKPILVAEATGAVVGLRWVTGGYLEVATGADEESLGDACQTTTATVPVGTARRVDVRVVPESEAEAGDGTIQVRIVNPDTQEVLETVTCADATTGTGNQTIRLGSTGPTTTDITYDDWFVADAGAWPGDVRWVPLRPSADSICSTGILTKQDQQDARYASMNEPPHDGEGSYLYNASATPGVCKFSTAAAAGQPVLSNPVYATRLSSFCKQTGSEQQTVALILGSSTGATNDLSTSMETDQRLATTNPANGAFWDTTSVGSTTIGIELSGVKMGQHALCSALQWNVAFVEGTPTPTNTATATNTPVNTATETAVPADTNTPTATRTVTNTPANTNTPTRTVTLTPKVLTQTPTNTPTYTRTVTHTPANTPTITETPVPTATLTASVTATATPVDRILARNATATGDSASFSARGGVTTVCLDKIGGGSISATAICRVVKGVAATDVVKGGALTADGCVSFTDYCEEAFLRVGTCEAPCEWSAYGRTSSQDVRWKP